MSLLIHLQEYRDEGASVRRRTPLCVSLLANTIECQWIVHGSPDSLRTSISDPFDDSDSVSQSNRLHWRSLQYEGLRLPHRPRAR